MEEGLRGRAQKAGHGLKIPVCIERLYGCSPSPCGRPRVYAFVRVTLFVSLPLRVRRSPAVIAWESLHYQTR